MEIIRPTSNIKVKSKKKRTPLKYRIMPNYTRSEEIFNMVTHIIGSVLAVTITVMCIVKAAQKGNALGVATCSIYGAFVFIMFTMSSIYHGLLPSLGKRVMQVIDHCDIYFCIAGTYTPILLLGVIKINPILGWALFFIQWITAVVACVFTAIDIKKYFKLSFACYLIMGWCIIIAFIPTLQSMTIAGFMWVLFGGVSFTLGAIIYIIGKKTNKKYAHAIFHIFVVLGVILQFFGIYLHLI